jgi:hypothetical protein
MAAAPNEIAIAVLIIDLLGSLSEVYPDRDERSMRAGAAFIVLSSPPS